MSGWNRTTSLPTQATDPINAIPMAAEHKPRNRDYEKQHPKTTYRITDENLAVEILAIAQDLTVSADDVARAFAEAGLRAARANQLDFSDVRPSRGRMSLYPTGSEKWVVHDEPVDWSKVIPAHKKAKTLSAFEKSQRQKERNRLRVHYRWPETLVRQIEDLTNTVVGLPPNQPALRSEGRKGQILSMLLRYGIEAYKAGRLPLNPCPVVVKSRLK